MEEYELTMDVVLVPSNKNMADGPTDEGVSEVAHHYEDGAWTQAIDRRYSRG